MVSQCLYLGRGSVEDYRQSTLGDLGPVVRKVKVNALVKVQADFGSPRSSPELGKPYESPSVLVPGY